MRARCSTACARAARCSSTIARDVGLDADDTRSGIGALVASGLAASDGFSGLRALLVKRARDVPWCAIGGRPSPDGGAPIPASATDMPSAGAAVESLGVDSPAPLRRGLSAPAGRENVTPAQWGELTRVYTAASRHAARFRGGHFVSGMSGEPFALPRAIERFAGGPALGSRRQDSSSSAPPIP
jgi:hypothetical protein